MIRAMAKEAEATRERKAAMIRADGELLAAKKLTEAAKLLRGNDIAIDLRRLQTIERISKEPRQKTLIIPDEVFADKDSMIGAALAGMAANDGRSPVLDKDDSERDNRFVLR